MSTIAFQPDPKLDLVFERLTDVSPELVWRAWTTPELIKQWFTPAPWRTVECELDLRPGGIFRTVMRSPEGEDFPNAGCYLEVIENRQLAWTNALLPGYRPADGKAISACGEFFFTAVITLTPHGAGTKYTALVIHGDEAACQQHHAMGFHDGWGKAFDQLVALMKPLS